MITEKPILTENVEKAPSIAPLTAAMARGEEDAFREFFRCYFHRLLRYLLVMANGNEDVAREALQLTLIRVARYVKPFETETAFWNWLAVLARSALVDEQRKSSRYLSFLTRWFEQRPSNDSLIPERNVERRLEDCLTENICNLDEQDQQLLTRKYMNGESVREIAGAMSISEKALESRLSRLRFRLKNLILERLKNEK